jgi:hypothetical protein
LRSPASGFPRDPGIAPAQQRPADSCAAVSPSHGSSAAAPSLSPTVPAQQRIDRAPIHSEAAAEELGTTTKRDTINTALREIVDRNRRLRALRDLQELAQDGALDTDLLLDQRNYRNTPAR